MRKRSIGIVGICSLWMLAAPAFGEAPTGVVASAEVPVVNSNVAKARKEALTEALVSVNLSQAERMVSPSVWLENQDIVSAKLSGDPRPFIKDFRVRAKASDGVMRVEVSAAPREERLRTELLKWGILYDRARRPRIEMIPLEEQRTGSGLTTDRSTQWTTRVAQRLRGMGFLVVDASSGHLSDIAIGGYVSAYKDQAISISLSGFQKSPSLELAKVQGSYPVDQGPDLAAGLAVSALLEKLLPAWFRVSGEGKEYAIEISGIKSYKQYTEIRELFNSGRGGFASGKEGTYAPGAVTFRVVYGGAVKDLVSALTRVRLSGGQIQVVEASGQTVSATVR